MKKSLLFTSILGCCLFIFSCTTATDSKSTNSDMDDIVEVAPEKKVNAPSPVSRINKKNTIDGTFLLFSEEDGYTYLHMKDGEGKENSFILWDAYEGVDQLNPGNQASVKGKKIRLTWENDKVIVPEDKSIMKIKKVKSLEML